MLPQPKRVPYRNQKILDAARDEPCLVNLPGCTGGGADTQPAHSNSSGDGKGKGQKADDIFVAFACHHCHSLLDGRKMLSKAGDITIRAHGFNEGISLADIQWYHDRGIKRTIRRLLDKGVIR
jgi:hypothetical protein